MAAKILVVGAGGYFGSLLVEELLRYTDCEIIAGGRDVVRLERLRSSSNGPVKRLALQRADLNRPETLYPALAQARVAVCAAGPFQALPTTLAELCLERGIHYIDLADDRGFVARVRRIAQQRAGCAAAVCPGWSAVPALSGLLARIAAEGMDRVDSIRAQIAPGNRSPRNVSTVASLLASVGRPFAVRRNGQWRTVFGWSEPRVFDFPSPVGPRAGYLVDAPDHEIFPELFEARCVEFRAGSELALLNRAVSLLSWLARKGFVRDWTRWASPLRRAAALWGSMGHDCGAIGTEVIGSASGRPLARRVCVVAEREGQRIAVMPAAVMAKRLVSGNTAASGLVPVDRWLDRKDLELECRRRGYELVVEDILPGKRDA